MDDLIPGIRNAVRAVIHREGAILVQHKRYEGGEERFTLPGGAPDLGETLEQALRRECVEEIGVEIEVVDLLHIADFYKPRETDPPTRRQQVEILFRCTVPDCYEAGNGSKPDKHQIDVVWLPVCEIVTSPLFPPSLKDILAESDGEQPVYLGLID